MLPTAQESRKRIRKQLAECGADPFVVAADAVARNEELAQRIAELEAMLRR